MIVLRNRIIKGSVRRTEILREGKKVRGVEGDRLLTNNGIECIVGKAREYLSTVFRDGSTKKNEPRKIRYVIREFLGGKEFIMGNMGYLHAKDCVEGNLEYESYDMKLRRYWEIK